MNCLQGFMGHKTLSNQNKHSVSWVHIQFLCNILAEWFECSPMVGDTRVQSHVESYQRLKKWYLMPPCLTLSIIKYGSRVKWSNPGNRVAPSSIPQCSSYWKGAFGSPPPPSTNVANFIYLRVVSLSLYHPNFPGNT